MMIISTITLQQFRLQQSLVENGERLRQSRKLGQIKIVLLAVVVAAVVGRVAGMPIDQDGCDA